MVFPCLDWLALIGLARWLYGPSAVYGQWN